MGARGAGASGSDAGFQDKPVDHNCQIKKAKDDSKAKAEVMSDYGDLDSKGRMLK